MRALVSADEPDVLHRARALLPPGWKPCPSSAVTRRFTILTEYEGSYELVKDQETFSRGFDLDLTLGVLDAQIRMYVASHALDRIFVHAGVVAHRGRTIIIPGNSFSGKTTLVAALVRAGATYYSDEFAPIDEDGFVHPYAKPLSVRDHAQVQHEHDVGSLGGTAGEHSLPIGLIVSTAFTPGAQWRPKRLSPGEGVLALLSHTVVAQTRPEQVMRFLSRSVGGAVTMESPRGEADGLAPLLLSELE